MLILNATTTISHPGGWDNCPKVVGVGSRFSCSAQDSLSTGGGCCLALTAPYWWEVSPRRLGFSASSETGLLQLPASVSSASGSATSRSLFRTLPIFLLFTGHMVSASCLIGTRRALSSSSVAGTSPSHFAQLAS